MSFLAILCALFLALTFLSTASMRTSSERRSERASVRVAAATWPSYAVMQQIRRNHAKRVLCLTRGPGG